MLVFYTVTIPPHWGDTALVNDQDLKPASQGSHAAEYRDLVYGSLRFPAMFEELAVATSRGGGEGGRVRGDSDHPASAMLRHACLFFNSGGSVVYVFCRFTVKRTGECTTVKPLDGFVTVDRDEK